MNTLKKLFTPPVFEDELKTQHAYILHIIVWTLAFIPIPYVVYTLAFTPEHTFRMFAQTAFAEIVTIILLVMMRRGYVKAASILQAGAIWLFFTATAATGAGVSGAAYTIGYALVISISGILLGGAGALIFTLLSLATGAFMTHAQIQGYLNNPSLVNSPLTIWVISLMLFPVGAVLQYLSARTVRNSLARARTSEERYRLISRVSSDYTFSTELDTNGNMHLNWVAGAFEKITGYTREEYIANGGWLAHLHPDHLEQDAQDMATLKKNQRVVTEVRTYTKNKELRWVRSYAHPVWDEKQNRLTGIVGAVQDITEQKQAEEALRKSEAIYRQAIEVAGAVPYRQNFDANGRIVYDFMGEGIRQITGYGPEEFDDDLWGSLTQERHLLEDLAEYSLNEAIQNVRSGKNPIWKCEHRIKARDGKVHWVFEAAVDLRDEHGIAHGSIGMYQDITERKRSEEALKYERDLLQIFMDNIPDTVYFKDTESRFVRVNKAQAQFLKLNSPLDAIGKTDLDFQNPELAWRFMEEEKQIVATGQPVVNRIEFNPTADGKPRWLSATKVPVNDSAGTVIGTIGISRDVTEQKESQEKLQRIFLQQAAILNNIPDIAWLKDKDSRYIAVNEQFSKRVGMKMDDIIGKTDLEIWHNEYAERYRNDDLEVMQTRQRRNTEELETDSMGDEYWVETSKTPILNTEGEVIGTTGIARDISNRKEAEKAEQLRREMLEKIVTLGQYVAEVQNLPTTLQRIWKSIRHDLNFDRLGIYLYDREHNTMNGTYGTSGQGEMVEEWDSHISLNDKTIEATLFMEVIRNANGLYVTRDYESDHNIPEGHIMSGVKAYAAVAARTGDKPVAVLCVDNAISKRPITKEQLEALRLFAGYAGLAIENARLYTALEKDLYHRATLIEELDAKNAELERFTYTVSHDLKSPLVTITGFLGYLEQDALAGNTERIKNNMNRILGAAHKMQTLLNDLLELSRIGRIMNSPEAVPFEEIVHDAVDRVRGKLDEIDAIVEIQRDLPVVNGDRTRLVEVIQNLIENAAKYSKPESKPRIEIGTEAGEQNQNVFFVRDNGIGIAPIYHENIFGLFNKLNATSEGTGIGLTLVKRIIEVHGGRIWVVSDLGKGATFYFTLPTQEIKE